MFGLLPIWIKLAIVAAIVSALVGLYAWRVHVERDVGRDEVRAEWARDRDQQKTAALAEAEANAKETLRRLARQKEVQDANAAETARLQAAAARVDAANGRLSRELADFTAAACGAASDTGAVCDRKAASAALGVLAELYRSARTRAAILGRTADAARAAGVQCTAEYDALTVKP